MRAGVRLFCAGYYLNPHTKQRQFNLVSPSGYSPPYVCNNRVTASTKLFPLCAHHSSLYELVDNCAILRATGELTTTRCDGNISRPPERIVRLRHSQITAIITAPIWGENLYAPTHNARTHTQS